MSSDFLKNNRQTLHRYPTDFLIGDLLVKTGIIRQSDLDEAVKLAGNKQMQVGQMLIMARHLTPAQLQIAVDAQSALRDRHIDMNAAIKGIKFACKSGLSFSEAMSTQETTASKLTPTNKLGELLLEAGLITPDDFGKALQRSQATGLPLGRILVLNGSITDAILNTALEIQVRIRDQMLTRLEAIGCLRAAANIGTANESFELTNEVQAALKKPRRKGMRLGELLVMAGVLAEPDVMNALEVGLVNDQPMGQILVNQGFITTQLLDGALELQELVDQDNMEPQQAAELLNKIHTTGIGLHQALTVDAETAPTSPSQLDFRGLLSVARIAGEEEIASALEMALSNPPILMHVLVSTGLLDERVAESVLKCHSMMLESFLSQEDAVVALDYCLQKFSEGAADDFTFEHALLELGWTFTPEEPQDTGPSGSTVSDPDLEITLSGYQVTEPTLLTAPATTAEHIESEKVLDFSVEAEQNTANNQKADEPCVDEITGDHHPAVAASTSIDNSKEAKSDATADVVSPAKTLSKLAESANPTAESPASTNSRKKPMSLKALLSSPNEKSNEATPGSSKDSSTSPAASQTAQAAMKAKSHSATLQKLAALVGTPGSAAAGESSSDSGNEPAPNGSQSTDTSKKVGESYLRLAESYYEHGNYFEAEILYSKVLRLHEKSVGDKDPVLVNDLNSLSNVLCQQGKFGEAKEHLIRAIDIMENSDCKESYELAESLSSLAGIYYKEENYAESEPLLLKSLKLRKQILGEEHPAVADSLRDLAKLYRNTNRSAEAEEVYAQAKKIMAREVKRTTI